MDSGSVVACGRRKRKPSRSEGEDRISKLPDFVIGRILSFVPIEDAVRTSVLSKSWISLWKFIPHLLFQDTEPFPEFDLYPERNPRVYFDRFQFRFKWLDTSKMMEKNRFVNLVNGILRHLGDSSIESFTLIISQDYYASQVNEWISSALKRRVKILYVHSYKYLTLPCFSILQFQYLEELVLLMSKHDSCVISFPSSVCFPSLTVLSLYQITFAEDHESSNKENLTLLFPVLRKFEAISCCWFGAKCVTFEAPLLQEVSILSNVSFPRITFHVSHLTEFTYSGFVFPRSWYLDLSAASIASANIQLFTYDPGQSEQVRNVACKFLKQFTSNVEHLTFKWAQIKDVELVKDSLTDLSPSKMLRHLELDLVTIEILLGLLLNTPFLKTLNIYEGIFEFDTQLLNFTTVPDCFRSNLQLVQYECFPGFVHELSFAKFVLENAEVLQMLTLLIPENLCPSNPEDVKEKLFSFKKASSVAVIEFY